MESWRGFLKEGTSPYKDKIIFLDNGAAIIGVGHGESINRELTPEQEKKLKQAADVGYYFEGKGEDVSNVKKFLKRDDIKNLGQWDSVELDDIDWAYTLFTGNYNLTRWPSVTLNPGEKQQYEGHQGQEGKIDILRANHKKGKATAGDVIKLMLTSPEFDPKPLSEKDADRILSMLKEDGVNVDDSSEKILNVMENAHNVTFTTSGTEMGKLQDKANSMRRNNLLDKLKTTGGIGIIGYSHLESLKDEYKVE
jgi:hypothetical protein